MILLTILITSLIARKKAKANSDKALALSLSGINSETKTPLQKYAEWLQQQPSL